MSDTKFTPGPWRTTSSGNFFNTIEAPSGRDPGAWGALDDGYSTVASVQACCTWNTRDKREENLMANMSLVSAAPDLYAALAWVRSNVGLDMEGRRIVDAALAKARGETA